MKLSQTIQQARDLTQLLQEALEAHDLSPCEDLLARREQAMAGFTEAHRNASTKDRERCQDEVRTLAEDDRRLQKRSRQLLELVKGEFRGQLGQSAQGTHATGIDTTQACLDRKA